ncbi:hypothetical protein DAMA08_039190 [Martiniozyma asiatica (nom. inval.)]|nr:hypothetical protein DAMA08_039190 [Martiniozyma asiatica]
MVLHNDKWKNKAKRAYQKKHGLNNKNTTQQTSIDSEFDSENNSEESTHLPKLPAQTDVQQTNLNNGKSYAGILGGVEVQVSDATNKNDAQEGSTYTSSTSAHTRRKKISNSWRFLDPSNDPELLRDPEYAAELAAKEELERDRVDHYRSVITNKLKEDSEYDASNEGDSLEKVKIIYGGKKKKAISKMRNEDILGFSGQFSGTGTDSDSGSVSESNSESENETEFYNDKPIIRKFTEEEKQKFLTLQNKIKHNEEIDKMRSTINRYKPSDDFKVMHVNTKADKNAYRPLIDESLKNAHKKTFNEDEFDYMVEDLIGVRLSSENSRKIDNTQSRFNVGTLISNSQKSKEGNNSNLKFQNKPKHKVKVNLDDDFLDSVL